MERLINDYYILSKKLGNINLNFSNLKKIEFNDDNILNNIRRFKLRYNLNKIFGNNVWCKIIKITFKDFENIFEFNEVEKENLEKKINWFKNTNTNFKLLYLDLENNSPYQKQFYYFCKNYLNDNKNINTLILNNIGNINYDNEFFSKMKNNEKIKLSSLIQILYENNLTEKKLNNNEIKDFINLFFDYNNKLFIY